MIAAIKAIGLDVVVEWIVFQTLGLVLWQKASGARSAFEEDEQCRLRIDQIRSQRGSVRDKGQ